MEGKKGASNLILSSATFENEKDYWLKKLSGNIKLSSFPIDKERVNISLFQQETVKYKLTSQIGKKIVSMVRGSELGIFMILVSGVFYLIERYTGDEDIIIGMPLLFQKNNDDYFNDIVPLKTQVRKQDTFKELMESVKKTVIEAVNNQDYPLEKIFELLDYKVDYKKEPIMKTLVLLEGTHRKELIEDKKSDLVFSFSVEGEEINLNIQYNKNLYELGEIQSIFNHLQKYFFEITNNPNVKICDINILSEEERKKVIVDFNNTHVPIKTQKTINEMFEDQVKKDPNAIAVVFNDVSLTYKELNEKANKVANYLRKKGVGPDSIVGIMIERSLEMIVGVIGIIKSGGAYLPIDTEYPDKRIASILEDSGTKIILSKGSSVKASGSNILQLDILDESIEKESGENLSILNTEDNLLYIIYTSGSTGKPKGVMLEHKNLVNLLNYEFYGTGISFKNKVLQFTTICFDVSFQEIFSTLISGGELHLIKADLRNNIVNLFKYIEENEIKVLFLPTALVKVIFNEEEYVKVLPTVVKHIITAGEQLIINDRVKEFINEAEICIHNHYGPSETHVVTTYTMAPGECIPYIPPIGKPIYNNQCYILDENKNIQPVGLIGELYIAGESVGRGYLNNHELTKEKFMENPFIPNTRMYKTGDLARWMPDGNIDFLGRKDYQVKLRGFRIELPEIEGKLINHPLIKEAVVVDLTDSNGSKYLCAYVVPISPINSDELKKYLNGELPEYMIPAYFVQLSKLPVNSNGKVDRKELPASEINVHSTEEYVEPRNSIEEKLVKVWGNILGIEKIGINDNFFNIGGDSLKAIQMMSKLIVEFDISNNDIFKYQTIATLAEKLTLKSNNLRAKIDRLKKLVKDANKDESEVEKIRSEKIQWYNAANNRYNHLDLSEKIKYTNIFLTGSTGYLGIHLLEQLLINTDCNIYLPIRKKDGIGATERLRKKLEFYFDDSFYEDNVGRMFVLECDITQKNLGLSQKIYNELSENIDCIINSAANVKHYGISSEFYDINVELVKNLVEFAVVGRKKDLNHISTIGVGKGNEDYYKSIFFSEYDTDTIVTIDNQYIKSKQQAEKIVIEARNKGIRSNIFRCGNLSYNSKTGKFQQNISNNAFLTFIKSFVEIGTIPDIDRKLFEMSFIDYVSKAVILLFNRENLFNEVYHLCNLNDMGLKDIGQLIQKCGYDTNFINTDQFMEFLYDNYESYEYKEHITNILLNIYLLKIFSDKNLKIASSKTVSILERLDFEWPSVNEKHIEELLTYCRNVKFIKKQLFKTLK